nr:recombinase family protein [Miniphocaeibacter massiliensis]
MIIPARRDIKKEKENEKPKVKVAAYCRVSTDSEEQMGSFETQVQHYTNYISKNPDWILADIYADDGISGTNTKNRNEFNRMIKACNDGNIDMIITKSISRFARNTLDCLKYIRELKDLGIPVYFEKENINTMDSKGEVLLTIMASLAQQESQSLSQNIKLGYQYRFQQGQVIVNATKFLGYTKDDKKQLIIVPEEAEIVKRIFLEFLEGKGPTAIARGLENDKCKTATGITRWSNGDIYRILRNEKYMGDALLQKSYTVDFLTRKRVNNKGIMPQYYVEDNHEGIVSKEVFRRAQEELARRSNLYSGKRKQNKRVHLGKYALSGIVFCSNCEDIFRRIKWNSRGFKSIVWRCVTRVENGPEKCKARTVKEDLLHEVVVEAINVLIENKNDYVKIIEENVMKVLDEKFDVTVDDIDEKLHELQNELIQKSNSKTEYERIAEEIYELRDKKQEVMIANATRSEKRRRVQDIKAYLKTSYAKIENYDESLVRRIIDKIIVYDDYMEVEFKTGNKIEIKK